MKEILGFAMGPLFRLCFAVMILGLLRIVVITVWGMGKTLRNTQDGNVPYRKLLGETLGWLIPLHVFQTRLLFNLVSTLFHIGLIVVPLFLSDHILLWRKGLGVSYPAIPRVPADALTLITIFCALSLLAWRIFDNMAKTLSHAMDYVLLLLLIALFMSGFIASRPYNPIPYNTALLIHVLCGNAVLFLIPFSKLAHCFLYPLARIASNIAWRFPSGAGERINLALYNEEIKKI